MSLLTIRMQDFAKIADVRFVGVIAVGGAMDKEEVMLKLGIGELIAKHEKGVKGSDTQRLAEYARVMEQNKSLLHKRIAEMKETIRGMTRIIDDKQQRIQELEEKQG